MIDVDVILEGKVVLGDGVTIGPFTRLKDVTLGAGTEVRAHCDVEGVISEGAAQLGPFARLRPGTVLADGVHVGNFVETKKVTLGVGSKANHLTYLGDAVIGSKVNIGAGTITCNYDGVNKGDDRCRFGHHPHCAGRQADRGPCAPGNHRWLAAPRQEKLSRGHRRVDELDALPRIEQRAGALLRGHEAYPVFAGHGLDLPTLQAGLQRGLLWVIDGADGGIAGYLLVGRSRAIPCAADGRGSRSCSPWLRTSVAAACAGRGQGAWLSGGGADHVVRCAVECGFLCQRRIQRLGGATVGCWPARGDGRGSRIGIPDAPAGGDATGALVMLLLMIAEVTKRNAPPVREPSCCARRYPALLGPSRDGAGTRCAQTPAPLRLAGPAVLGSLQGGPKSKATAAPSRSTPCVDAFALLLESVLKRAEHRCAARRLAAGGTLLLVTFLCVQRKSDTHEP
ncbi:bifunctional protein GlmU [Ditylenchus destructor]|uniref:UDP-N-acetylglucosamine diphosphorylase n=1 Tax=Ditylenchus destructor TaxID=166010 RepID=A0AAD4MFA5_9BILA|nr:bifunctional protein GlmU [Ditylenchus destructor]